MRKVITYFIIGILPILLLTLPPLTKRYGINIDLQSSSIAIILALMITGFAWGIALYNIRLGYEILDSLVRLITIKRMKVRILRIEISPLFGMSECKELFYLEKEVVGFFGSRWVPIKNSQIFMDLRDSDSIAYFPDRETAIMRMKSLSAGEWKKTPDFDQVTIESEFYV